MKEQTNQQILEKAIQKAIDGGMTYYGFPENGWGVAAGQWHTTDHHLCQVRRVYDHYIPYRDIIFNHDFANAVFGDKEHDAWIDDDSGEYRCTNCDGNLNHAGLEWCWQYHLQQMVIADDPIKYLGENI